MVEQGGKGIAWVAYSINKGTETRTSAVRVKTSRQFPVNQAGELGRETSRSEPCKPHITEFLRGFILSLWAAGE